MTENSMPRRYRRVRCACELSNEAGANAGNIDVPGLVPRPIRPTIITVDNSASSGAFGPAHRISLGASHSALRPPIDRSNLNPRFQLPSQSRLDSAGDLRH